MGRETQFKPNTPLIYLYDDGSTERVQLHGSFLKCQWDNEVWYCKGRYKDGIMTGNWIRSN